MRRLPVILAFLSVLFAVLSCSDFRKIEKSEDWRVKYEAALRYYGDEDYYRASILFEQILPIVRGLPEGERVQFNLAYCHYHDRLYLLASEQFRTFYETYGRSPLAEEARFMFAYSLYAASPGPNLDQTSSIEAMAAMQEFLNRFPRSEFAERAMDVIAESQLKLEQKGFANAAQYHKMRQYNAAIVALNNFANNFPDSRFLEEAHFLIIESEFKLAEQSVLSKQPERYKAVTEHYLEFLDRFPSSQYLKEAERYYAESLEKVNKLKSSNS